MLYVNTCWLTFHERNPVIPMNKCFPPRINVVYNMLGVYANLICVSCKYDFASNFRWNVAKIVA